MTTYTATPIVLVNPARAGMIPLLSKACSTPLRKPRASGDDPGVCQPPAPIPV